MYNRKLSDTLRRINKNDKMLLMLLLFEDRNFHHITWGGNKYENSENKIFCSTSKKI